MDLFNQLADITRPETQNNSILILGDIYESARRAYSGISFDPEKRANSIVKEYSAILEEDLKLIESTSEENKTQYKERFKYFLLQWLSAKSRVVSPMIAGPANFPTQRMQKYNNWENSAYNRFKEWREKAQKAILKQIEAAKTPEEKDAEIWKYCKTRITEAAQTIKDIDLGICRQYSRPLFVSVIAKNIETHVKWGRVEIVKKAINLINELNETAAKPIISKQHKIFKAIDEAEKNREKAADREKRENSTIYFEGGEITSNYQIDRLQLKYDEKPSEEMRNILKKNGFKWAPSLNVWQRQLTGNAMFNLKYMIKDGFIKLKK